MKLLIVITSLFYGVLANAADPQLISVKVYSGACSADVQKWRGSGVLFNNGGSTYVLTSNHVLLNGNGSYCHEVSNSEIGTRKTTLVTSDWGMGLALLKLNHSLQNSRIPERSNLFSTELKLHDQVTANAFPYDSTQALSSSQGEVVSVQSDRHFFANSFFMTELAGAHAEFGMSGGPVFSGADTFGGILSHQAIMMVAGQDSRIVDFSVAQESNRIFNQVFVIPTAVVRQWLNRVFTQIPFVPSISESPDLQIQGEEKVFTDGLQFSLTTINPDGAPIGGANGSGVGGANGSGVGGANGSGIGGDQGSGPLTPHQGIEITLSPDGQITGNYFETHHLSSWVNVVKHSLQSGFRVMIPVLVRTQNQTDVEVYFSRLDEFFRLMSEPSMRAVTQLVPSSSQQSLGESSTPQDLAALSLEAKQLIEMDQAAATRTEEKVLLKNLSLKMELLRSIEWKSVSVAELKDLSNGYGSDSKAWAGLLLDSRDNTIELLQNLTRICDDLSRFLN